MLETAKHHRDSLGIALISLHYHPTLFPRRRDRRLANKSHAGQWKGEHEISGLDFRIELVVIKRAVLLVGRKSHAAHDMGYRILIGNPDAVSNVAPLASNCRANKDNFARFLNLDFCSAVVDGAV